MSMQLTAKTLAENLGATAKGAIDNLITGIASLNDPNAKAEDVSFLSNKKYQEMLPTTKVGTILVSKELTEEPREGQAFIVCDNVDACFIKTIHIFAPEPIKYEPGVHPSAVVDSTVKLGENVHIGANAVVEANAEIGDNTVVGANCYVGHFTKIGSDCLLYANVAIRERCVIGNRVIIHLGATIGSDGYGFIPGPTGIIKIPQVGIVQIDDDVEIGANTSIDRARFGKTWIKTGVKIDNLVMVAHNVVIGEYSMIIAQSGMAGSAELGRGVILGAQGGVNGHITIGDGVKIAATSGVVKSVPPGMVMAGTPAVPQREVMDRLTIPKRFRKLKEKVEKLEKELAELKK